ncbi:MAG: lipid-A-disaccharide synthase, partial [Nostocales cyanobacterium W4_Combined_metabat2_030]|nr:lipid-A-disaccharide synthase [Nostocales cyanobacterium W4_Combined_metabat2_030]
MTPVDILILSNGPGEVTTWVRPVVKALREQLGHDISQVRISVILSPCPHASGKETVIALSYPEVDRVQAAEHFWQFLLWGKTAENWEWRNQGVVIFLGGDQIFPVIIGKKLGYKTVVYAEWEARWHNFIDKFAIMKGQVAKNVASKYADKFTIVGDLMLEAAENDIISKIENAQTQINIIGILPGSKAAKLTQGVPLTLAIAEYIHSKLPQTKFFIPVAPTLDLPTLASFANPENNLFTKTFNFQGADLID